MSHQQSPPKQHLHNPTGITDEAALEGHDLIHNAEVEERKLHGKDALCEEDAGEETKSSSKGPMDKVKEALNLKK